MKKFIRIERKLLEHSIDFSKTSLDSFGHEDTDEQSILLDDSKETEERFHNFGWEIWVLNKEELEALISGKTLARQINGGEYGCFLKVEYL